MSDGEITLEDRDDWFQAFKDILAIIGAISAVSFICDTIRVSL